MPISSTPSTLNTLRTFPALTDLEDWEERCDVLRTRILVSCGLFPLPRRSPLRTRIFGRAQRDGYSIEKVAIQTYPGFYLAGNLYRPTDIAAPSPGVLIAHGHWEVGRMADEPRGSIPARAITFARMGCVAFTYDMVGYNDTRQIDHKFADDRKSWLWGVSLMGLQTWNSIRALDFLAALPDVDRSRLAITGESGGGTQTMILGAIDERLAAVAPCVMVSHSMQGGCLCENAPALRIDHSNMEIAACAAPRPQILVGATGDWTATTMTVEGPAIESVYRLYGKADRFEYGIVDADHNINRESREKVYAFFGKHLLGRADPDAFRESPYTMEPPAELRVFPDGAPLPTNARSAEELTQDLITSGETLLHRRKPRNRRGLTAFKRLYRPLWELTLAIDLPPRVGPPFRKAEAERSDDAKEGGRQGEAGVDGVYSVDRVNIVRGRHHGALPALLFSPARMATSGVVVADPAGIAALVEPETCRLSPLITELLRAGRRVLVLDAFLTGSLADHDEAVARRPFDRYFTTYNRTDLQERVQDLILGCAFLRARPGVSHVGLIGQGVAGLWALLAAPVADAVAADCARLDLTTDDGLLSDDLFTPCLRRMGDFRATTTLAAPNPLLLHNTGDRFTPAQWIAEVYAALNVSSRVLINPQPLTEATVIEWTQALW